jgi:mRNA interferase YafQ
MRLNKWSVAFKRDFKRESKGTNRYVLKEEFYAVIYNLSNDIPLPAKYQDHQLTGNWEGYRSCHLKPDLLLIYENPDDETLRLVRLSSHSELF